jgi:Glycosyl hydrolases family 35
MLLPRHVGNSNRNNNNKPLNAYYYHYGGDHSSSSSSIGCATTTTLRAENRHLHSPSQRRQEAPPGNIHPASSSSSSSQFVARLYSHRNGSSYIRYQPLEENNDNSNDSNSNKNNNNNNNKDEKCYSSCRGPSCYYYYYYYYGCSQHGQRRCCFLSGTLIFIILLFGGAGRALFQNSTTSAASSTGTTTTTTTTSSSSSSSTTPTTTTGSRSSSFKSWDVEKGSEFQEQQHTTQSSLYSRVPSCTKDGMPCFYQGRIQVQPNHAGGFPSYWDYAGPMNVTTSHDDDGRRGGGGGSIWINGDRVLLIAGSMHPARATRMSWELALDEAVRNGLNLVTIDVFWSAHQPYRDSPLDWSMSASQQPDWQLKDALYSCASRGLFVHLRIVAGASGEYSLGGIPEWFALQYPNMQIRPPDDAEVWRTALSGFIKATMEYMKKSQLWAPQGGPIIMAQVEKKLVVDGGDCGRGCVGGSVEEDWNGDDDEDKMGDSVTAETTSLLHRPQPPQATTTETQAYSDCCKTAVANKLVPSGVVWLKQRDGESSRVPLNQPTLWTLDDGGFQQWGGGGHAAVPANKNRNDWRKTAAGMSHTALQWFARGGTHLNYYMWWGGYNRGRSAAASMLNAYDTHAVLCPSGERHQPKFAHFQALHAALAEIAPVLLHAPQETSSLGQNHSTVVQIMNDTGYWEIGGERQTMFVYKSKDREAIFVENNLDAPVVARVPCSVAVSSTSSSSAVPTMVVLEMQPRSSVLLIDGMVRFDSGAIQPRAMAFARRFIRQPVILLDWATWQEPVGVGMAVADGVHVDSRPLEQTALNNNINDTAVQSDYAWYQTTFTVENHLDMATLRVDTQKANGIVAFLDGKYVDAADNHERSQGTASLYLSLGSMKSGTHQVALLSESFGYDTLMTSSDNAANQNTASVQPQRKGITGDVVLSSPSLRNNMNLVDGSRQWLSFAGLHAERVSKDSSSSSSSSFPTSGGGVWREHLQKTLQEGWGSSPPSTASWSAAYFDSPRYDPSTQGLFLRIRSGRGHLWLNGRDLGRYWNITRRGGTGVGGDGNNNIAYSQEYYFLPNDYLYGDSGKLNEIVLFDVFGGDHGESELVLSWTEATSDDDEPGLLDEVDVPGACLV